MSIAATARTLAKLLAKHDRKLVCAESCTGGLVSGALTKVPGISAQLCGGVVVYRNETKTAYLGISSRLLKSHGAVSEIVAQRMAERVLAITPEADMALSVTGHLGPHAPPLLDGVAFMGMTVREKSRISTAVQRFDCSATLNRSQRQQLVVEEVLKLAIAYLVKMT